jgi:hypothetical protein
VFRLEKDLLSDYGRYINKVEMHALSDCVGFDIKERKLVQKVYDEVPHEPIFRKIADDFLRALAGDNYPYLEKYLYKVTDMSQILPAVVLHGPASTYKTTLARMIAPFWGTPYCKASKAFSRFNDVLLRNPVILSDEALYTENGKDQPARYRESITEFEHDVELKNGAILTLYSAVRHFMALNDVKMALSTETKAQSVQATAERFIQIETDRDSMEAFYKRWEGKEEFEDFNDGQLVREHIKWLQANKSLESEGRLFVRTNMTRADFEDVLFKNDLLEDIFKLCVEAQKRDLPHPITYRKDGHLGIQVGVLHEIWSKIAMGNIDFKNQVSPGLQRIGRAISDADIKIARTTKGKDRAKGGARVSPERLRAAIEATSLIDFDEFLENVKEA